MEFKHIPVMVEEVMDLLRCEPGRTYVDGTLGGGGHGEEILKRTGPDGFLIGMDWDKEAIDEASKRLKPYGNRTRIFRENFIHLPEILKTMKIETVDGILLDLGLSSIQLERGERGFSFRGEGPLDMRMDERKDHTAADLLNALSPEELERILFEYGEERWAKRIAKAIVSEREQEPIQTTESLRRIIYRTIPKRFQSRRIDPATRTFQAIRIKVNEELENLKRVLESGWKVLSKGGRICIISFHSLEDRIVKEGFRRLEREGMMQIATKKPFVPSEEEQEKNPRSRSAKLRCAERI
ncbi:MAG: 16S rRNA (cytosine(1402)-N(4))-methyltransferase RsmH [Deltaproteobacteria bacterium]|nr:16S rRNA (cytosine(1402)-N(4))-methyltransferase RsmH [Deltaproteobacteria bacterium]MBM4325122.1 16S rRNA (cytosine(1402)-N(4))-methyltransferase RsmH [Deltaproteobacteria bacterium]MBM4346706.1 16S rRNA (cytosine(1402)-N(4))-methyltransferase RsmH [Deltaproteobacteria bacterium]